MSYTEEISLSVRTAGGSVLPQEGTHLLLVPLMWGKNERGTVFTLVCFLELVI